LRRPIHDDSDPVGGKARFKTWPRSPDSQKTEKKDDYAGRERPDGTKLLVPPSVRARQGKCREVAKYDNDEMGDDRETCKDTESQGRRHGSQMLPELIQDALPQTDSRTASDVAVSRIV
jgi:hypothetical protein